ncbi:hypothetical protein [Alteromonas sp. a30]|nr:hypothetical protein [Alteromonas sp. a30]MCY7297556.1 hypothetical protein [Alteromonas sp. a30]
MPQLKPKTRKQATAKDVKSAAAVGNAQYEYFQKYGKFPKSSQDLKEFLR